MTRTTARRVANVFLGSAAVVAGYFIVTNPRLRRVAVQVLKIGMTTTVPGYLLKEAADAWRETGERAA